MGKEVCNLWFSGSFLIRTLFLNKLTPLRLFLKNIKVQLWDPSQKNEKNWHHSLFKQDFLRPLKIHSGHQFSTKNVRPFSGMYLCLSVWVYVCGCSDRYVREGEQTSFKVEKKILTSFYHTRSVYKKHNYKRRGMVGPRKGWVKVQKVYAERQTDVILRPPTPLPLSVKISVMTSMLLGIKETCMPLKASKLLLPHPLTVTLTLSVHFSNFDSPLTT